jgi:integrase
MRRGEIFNLRWEQVNFQAGVIYVERSKNGERREIPMNDYLVNTLKEVTRSSEYVFASKDRRPYDNVNRSYRTALREAGITNFRFHDLRHTFASSHGGG